MAVTEMPFDSAGGRAVHRGAWSPDAHPRRYWPCELLSAFMLQMAAKGHCVNESMMLGSRAYATEKLAQACSLNDPRLRDLTGAMRAYFDDEPCHAVATLLAVSPHH